MVNVGAALESALAKLKTIDSSTLSFVKDGATVTASVFKSYLRDWNRTMTDAGYEEQTDSLYVLATPADVSGWGLKPMSSEVLLDNVPYMVGQSITKATNYWTIFLRKKK